MFVGCKNNAETHVYPYYIGWCHHVLYSLVALKTKSAANATILHMALLATP